jgi:DHA2 family multidrug resistance protein
VPAASGLSNFLRIVAGGFATSIFTTFWDRREALHQSRLAELVTPYDPSYALSLTQLHGLGLNDQAAAGLLTRGVIGQAYLLSSLDLFYISGWLALALIPLCWIVARPASGGGAPAAAD